MGFGGTICRSMGSVLTLAAGVMLAAMVTAAPAQGQAVEITDPTTGRTFSYTPSFAPKPKLERPQYRFFDANQKRWVTYQASREDLWERHEEKFSRAVVRFHTAEPAGTIVVDTLERFLYVVNGDGTAVRFGIGVARDGFGWTGVERVTRKAEWPDWRPPAEMLEREPWLPDFMPGGPENPMGARALYLGSTLYRIHGTHQDRSIGFAVSSGCIRMRNEDVIELYERTRVGTEVLVLGRDSDRSGLMAALSAF